MYSLSLSAQRQELLRAVAQIEFPIAPISARDVGAFVTCQSWMQLETWANLVGFQSTMADPMLHWLLPRVRDRPEEYQDVLLLVAWSQITEMLRHLRRLDHDPMAVWSDITFEILRNAARLDVERRTHHIGRKLLNDTQHAVRAHYARERRLEGALTRPVDDGVDKSVALKFAQCGAEDPAFAALELRHHAIWARDYLRDLVGHGSMDRADYVLIIGCSVYGYSLESMAARLGLTYDAAKKRRQRALAVAQHFLKRKSPMARARPL